MRRGAIPWDPWLQDSPADTATMPADAGRKKETEPQPVPEPLEPQPARDSAAGPGAPSAGQAHEDMGGDAAPGPSGPWDPPALMDP